MTELKAIEGRLGPTPGVKMNKDEYQDQDSVIGEEVAERVAWREVEFLRLLKEFKEMPGVDG